MRRSMLLYLSLGGVAHLGERLNGIQEVRGSIPLISTNKKATAFAVVFLLVESEACPKGHVKSASRVK